MRMCDAASGYQLHRVLRPCAWSGLTLALQATTLRAGDFRDFYSVVVTVSRLAALVGMYLSVVGIFLVARIAISNSSGLPPASTL